jgi:hypothetical protein
MVHRPQSARGGQFHDVLDHEAALVAAARRRGPPGSSADLRLLAVASVLAE